ncbi:hypothetical protein K4K49_006849 [Colletotrichum sp. SAR 10_70]|nr:hypothetical protein K4K49_006849 [Colletotrichum sp. SAR 10_70]KAI8170479.1 hypothetical protein K4K50_006110 [Colletotrichum sp. SAR 10_71]KAI8180814.1 hypothetical protein K4K51_002251 [Colletotrichum sp. SAR 10_75]KAI8200273.1 hypothetical protein K4K52_008103 [Colletotrichum sp. SAR 10_76]KAI8221182.1 hypothetical protein K4K54_008015 [Colletotrichum sp. SAR 10_86]
MPYGHRYQWHSNPSHYQKCSSLIHTYLHVQVAEHNLYKALNRSYKQNFQQHRHDSPNINNQDFGLSGGRRYHHVRARWPGGADYHRFTFSFGRTQSSTEPLTEDDGSIDEKPTETDAADEKSAAAMTTRKGAKKVEDEEREWVIVPSNPEDEPEERAEPRGIFVSYGIGSPCGCSVKGEFRLGWGKGGAPTGEGS